MTHPFLSTALFANRAKYEQAKIRIEAEAGLEAGLGHHTSKPKRRKSESNLHDIPDEQVTLKVITITG